MDDRMMKLVQDATRKSPEESLLFLKKMAQNRNLDHQGYLIGIENILANESFKNIEKLEDVLRRNALLEQEVNALERVLARIQIAPEKEEKKSPGRPAAKKSGTKEA